MQNGPLFNIENRPLAGSKVKVDLCFYVIRVPGGQIRILMRHDMSDISLLEYIKKSTKKVQSII